MRLYSKPKSIQKGEVSLLAIAETLAAVTLVFYLSAHFNTLKWLAAAMCVAPLLLLRTDESVALGIRWFDWAITMTNRMVDHQFYTSPKHWVNRAIQILPVLAQAAAALIFLIGSPPIVRTAATIFTLFNQPFSAIRNIPRNWSRVVLAMDSAFPPELIPDHPEPNWTLGGTWRDLTAGHGFAGFIAKVLFIAVLFPILFLPALLYRWSLKATSIIYAPLVFVLHSTFRHVADLRAWLELIKRSDLTRMGTLYAAVFTAAFLLKLVLMMNLPGFAEWWNAHPMPRFAALYVAPAEIPKWQLASLANSALALIVMLGARQALLRMELGTPWPEGIVRHALGFTTGLRWLLTLYTILCTGYVTMNAARGWHWPALGTKWLPWL